MRGEASRATFAYQTAVEVDRAHQGFEGVGERVVERRVRAEVRPVVVDDEVLQAEIARERGEEVILDETDAKGRQPAFVELREEKEEMDGDEKFQKSIA